MAALIAIVPLVLIIFLGSAMRTLKILDEADAHVLNQLIINITLPAMIFLAGYRAIPSISLFVLPFIGWIVILSSLSIAIVVGKLLKLRPPLYGGFLLAAAAGNSGYLGYPLTVALFGESNLVRAVFYDIFATVLFVFTIGLAIADAYGTEEGIEKVRAFFSFPPLYALGIGFALHRFELSALMVTVLEQIASPTIPLILISVGLSLQARDLQRYAAVSIAASFIRLAWSPLVALFLTRALSLSPLDAGITVLEASTPSILLSYVFAMRYGLDTEGVATIIVVTTVLSVLTVPLFQAIV